MKYLMMLLVLFSSLSCATHEKKSWNGAQRQEALEDQTQFEQQDQIRNQFPGPRNF